MAPEAEGIPCWIAHRNIGPGAKWGKAIMDAIGSSRVMVLVFSEHANRSDQVARLLDGPFATSVLCFLRIESIIGTTVKLQTVDFRAEWLPYPEKELLVNVDRNGTITLIQ